jgi:hypothetical protein
LKQVRFQRIFKLKENSSIDFNGPFSLTTLNVDGVYATRARLYDLLTDQERNLVTGLGAEMSDAQTPQLTNVNLHMTGFLSNPRLTYDIDLEDKHSQSSYAYQKLAHINSDETQKLTEVVSLLLINAFVPTDGIGGSAALSGAVNNLSQVISSSVSPALTNVVNKLLKNKNYNVDVRYTNYNYGEKVGAVNRNAFTAKINRSYFDDRLMVEVGGTSDWGRPGNTSSASSSVNLAGDFRVQYKLSEQSNLRMSAFSTSDYDVLLDRNIVRSGVGLNWHKSFDRVNGLFRGNKYFEKQRRLREAAQKVSNEKPDSTGVKSGAEN